MQGIVRLAPAFVVGIVACSGGSSSGGSGGSVSADQACSDFASAGCQKLSSCTAFLIDDVYGDVATCTTRLKASCTDALAATGTGLTPAQRESCAQALPGAQCADLVVNNFPTACRAVAGQFSNGTTCGDSSQCQSTYCNLGADGTCGACGAARAAPGASCHRDDDCAYGSTCTNGACATHATSGGVCDSSHPCQQPLACKNGVCATPDEIGASCTMGSCDQLAGLYCTTIGSAVCKAITLAKAGEMCGVVNGVLAACSGGGHCKVVVGTAAGTCEAAAADGATCDSTNGPTCLPPAVCGATSKVCTLPNPAGCH
jgi:hypothetical protein